MFSKAFTLMFGRFLFVHLVFMSVMATALLVNLAFEKLTLRQALSNLRTFFFLPILILAPAGRDRVAKAFRTTFTRSKFE